MHGRRWLSTLGVAGFPYTHLLFVFLTPLKNYAYTLNPKYQIVMFSTENLYPVKPSSNKLIDRH
jgi:hypothetical protein